MKKFKIFLVAVLLLIGLTGCSKEENSGEEKKELTVSETLSNEFSEIVKNTNNIEEIATKLSKSETLSELSLMVLEQTKDDYLSGFANAKFEFKTARKVSPMIGSIPLVMYVFETDDAKTLEASLKEKANLRWNICTEADEMKTVISGNYVFFIMAPKSFDQDAE